MLHEDPDHRGRIVVFAPAPLLTVTIEDLGEDGELHLHPGGQGTWIARLAATLGAEVLLCASFGGESGVVARSLLEGWGIGVRAVTTTTWNGAYVHDRRSGDRRPIFEMPGGDLTRHEVDELYGAAFVAGLEADVVVLGSPEHPQLARGQPRSHLPLGVYRRLAHDLRANGVTVVADMSGRAMGAALEGGLDVLKVSDEDLCRHGDTSDLSDEASLLALHDLHERGAETVLVTRAERSTLALLDGVEHEVWSPTVQPVDPRGAGDAVTAGVAAGLAGGRTLLEAVQLGSAAGTLNATRHGLASGSRGEIERLAPLVEVLQR